MPDEDFYIVIERETEGGEDLLPYVIGPYAVADALAEVNSDDGLIYATLTAADDEGYVAGETYATDRPPTGVRIVPEG